MNANYFTRIVSPGTIPGAGRLFVTIEYKDGRLSLTGVEGPTASGNCTGGCGQTGIDYSIVPNEEEGWGFDSIAELRGIWDAWHLNDMRPGCVHQRHLDAAERLEVATYGLTAEAHKLRNAAITKATEAARACVVADLDETEKALLDPEWFMSRFSAPDADSPLSGCLEVRKREAKTAGFTYPKEHPRGLLGVECGECGYKYGSAWLREEVPATVLDYLRGLKDTEHSLPSAWR